MEPIFTNVWVGDEKDFLKIRREKGWAFLRCTKEGPDGHRDLLGYETLGAPQNSKDYLHVIKGNICALNLIDVDDPNLVPFDCIKFGLDFIKESLDKGKKILIACEAGHSRAPSVGLMFLRSIGDLPHNFVTSEKIYRAIYQKYDPAMGIRQVARSHWNELYKSEE